jgi:hypothetical protein
MKDQSRAEGRARESARLFHSGTTGIPCRALSTRTMARRSKNMYMPGVGRKIGPGCGGSRGRVRAVRISVYLFGSRGASFKARSPLILGARPSR